MTDENRPGDRPAEGAPTWWTGAQRQVWDTPPTDDTVHDVWAPTDTLGNEPRPPRTRTGLLVALAAAIALVAGVVGGSAGFLLAERDSGSGTIDGASLGAAPAREVDRPAGSIPGVAARVLPSVVQIKVDTSDGQATGSGFVIDENGVVVTNNHVVADAQGDVELTFSDGRAMAAKVRREVRELRPGGAAGGRGEPPRAAARQLRRRRRG